MNKFNVVLTSNGFINLSKRSEEIDKLFKGIANRKKVLIICNAANEKSANFVSRMDVKRNFENVGAALVDLIDLNNENATEILKYDILYVLGGQIQELLESMQSVKFRECLLEFLKQGTYIGESAGAVVLSDDVKWYYDLKQGTKDKYNVQLESYAGLGITDKRIFPHYNKASDEMKMKIKKYEVLNNKNIMPLNDGEFILEFFEVIKK